MKKARAPAPIYGTGGRAELTLHSTTKEKLLSPIKGNSNFCLWGTKKMDLRF